ncbi:hypothetical protein Q7P37_000936 [Cladosporium fusiforme]
MADDEETQKDDTAAASPSSEANNDLHAASKLPKDRPCPFCGQAFTSSSLGRHLDLYIKPKNPKPADGVHIVDEIRKIRGAITRRQPRSSLKRREGSAAATPEHTNQGYRPTREANEERNASEATPTASPVRAKEPNVRGPFMNAPSWHSTGVINDIPPRAPSRPNADAAATSQAQRVRDMRRDNNSGQRIQRPEAETENTWKLQEQAETGRAAEMALREVLGSLKAARKKVEPGPIYEDFDFFAQTFPGLCLAILPPPTTLFSPAPFASAESWSLKPPGAQQSDVLHRLFNDRVKELRRADPSNPPDSAIFRHSAHIQGAFENWRLMSEQDKQSTWTLEALRAFTTCRDATNRLKTRVSNAEQHASHLEAQYDRLSRCQMPREWLVRPPSTLPISSPVAHEIQKQSPHLTGSDVDFDPDAVLSRWREKVRAVTRPQRQSTSQTPTYASSAMRPSHHTDSIQTSMLMSGSVFGVNGPMPRNNTDTHGGRLGEHVSQDTVSYETPPNPGAVLEDDEQQDQSPYNYPFQPPEDADAELEEDVSNVLDTSLTNFVDRNALAKQRRFVQGSFSGSGGSGSVGAGTFGKFRINGSGTESPGVNSNGKRPSDVAGYGGANKDQRT